MIDPIDLRALADAHGYRTAMDGSADIETNREEKLWLARIPCRRGGGHIGVHGPTLLSAYATGAAAARLARLDGVRVVQRGDHEARVVFTPDRLDAVATLLQPYRRRQLSPEAREKATARLAAVSTRRRTEPAPVSG